MIRPERRGPIHREHVELLDLDAIRRDNPLPSVVGAVVKLQRAGNEFKACCPFHSEKSPSFTIFASGQRFYCFGCGAKGDVLDFVQRSQGVSLRDAAAMLGGDNLETIEVAPLPADDGRGRSEEAKAIWDAAQPASGTLVETYLRSRAITVPIPDAIRFARLRYGKSGPEYPALVAAVVSAGGAFTGIQRTYLTRDGTGKADVSKAKLSLGRVTGNAIRLAPPAASLVVCEGLEDGLSLQQGLGEPVWVAAGASMLPNMRFPSDVLSVAIGGDADDAGRAAARKAGEAFAMRGMEARVFFPVDAKDFNEQLMGRVRA